VTAEQAAAVVSREVERVFTTVSRVRDLVLANHRSSRERENVVHAVEIERLRPPLFDLLAENPMAIGLGVIFVPGLLPHRESGLEWWQSASDAPSPVRLEVDLRAESLDFYDYAAAEWFALPQQTGDRHVAGPYVDVHGTDRYLLTFTEPVTADGTFLGVAGVDVAVTRFETQVLQGLADLPVEILVIAPEGRVVLSTRSRWLTGDLVPADAAPERLPLLALSWQLAVTESGR
jgi:hypothetical protein